MSLGAIGKVLHSTRRKMITAVANEHAALFAEVFGIQPDGYVEILQNASNGNQRWTRARIAEVEHCYSNAAGGYVAILKVIPIRQTGEIGCSRRGYMFMNKNWKIAARGTGRECRPVKD